MKYIHLHPSKSAGTTIKRLLPTEFMHNLDAPYSVKQLDKKKRQQIRRLGYLSKMHHWTIDQLISSGLLENELSQAFKFTFVRNPFVRLISIYKHAKIKESFEKFIYEVETIVNSKKLYRPHRKLGGYIQANHLVPLNFYTQSKDETTQVNFIGKLENFETDVRSLFDLINIELPDTIPYHNKRGASCEKDINQYYTTPLKQIIYSVYNKDFEILDYN